MVAQLITISCKHVGDITVSVTDTPAVKALSSLQGLILCVFPLESRMCFLHVQYYMVVFLVVTIIIDYC